MVFFVGLFLIPIIIWIAVVLSIHKDDKREPDIEIYINWPDPDPRERK